MSITGYEVVEYTVTYNPGYIHVKPGTLSWDSNTGRWVYEERNVDIHMISGTKTYKTPLGKKIIWCRDANRLLDSGAEYSMPLIRYYRPAITPIQQDPPGEHPPYPQPEIDPEWENPPAPPVYTQTETFVIAHATSEIEV